VGRVALWEVVPGEAVTQLAEDAIQGATLVDGRTTATCSLTPSPSANAGRGEREEGLDKLPLFVGEVHKISR
jgi:hypothetical protein